MLWACASIVVFVCACAMRLFVGLRIERECRNPTLKSGMFVYSIHVLCLREYSPAPPTDRDDILIYGFQGYGSNFWDSSCVMRTDIIYVCVHVGVWLAYRGGPECT